jgi:hypothetical protein
VPAGNEIEVCGDAIMHEVQFLMNDQWHVGQEIRHVVFQESFVIPPCKSVWMYGKHLRELRKSVYHSAVLESLNSENMHFRTYIDINYFYYLHMKNPFLKLCRVFLKNSVYPYPPGKMELMCVMCVCARARPHDLYDAESV